MKGIQVKMKTVMICLNPFISHVVPTFELAKRLEKKNINIIYVGPEELKENVIEKNFAYISIHSYNEKLLQDLKRKEEFSKLEDIYREIHAEVSKAFIENRADMIFMGISRFLVYFLPAKLLHLKILFYSLNMGATGITCYNPPTTCGYIPSDKILSKLICLCLWGRRFIRKIFKQSFLIQLKHYPWVQLRQLSKKEKWKWRFGIDGIFPNVPIFIFGTNYLEFNSHNSARYTGLCLEKKYSWTSMNFPVSKTLIYCSLGTMASRYKNGASFVNAVIKSFCKNPQWHLIISLGGISKEKICLENLPLNVTIFDFAPQREILQYADLVLTHGGHGTIKECIEAGVLMIVFPCSYDQRGNAARVAYHRIGLRSLVLKKTFRQRIFNKGESYIASEDITLLIKEALSKQVYQENIKQIREKIKKADEMEEILHYILELINE